jgi:mRNA interferase MazF
MEKLVKGAVVVVPFPFSDLTKAKKRPALVLAVLEGDDLVLCQITSKQTSDSYAIALPESAFATGTLKQDSNARPNKLFTADKSIVLYKAGTLKQAKLLEVIEKLFGILKQA